MKIDYITFRDVGNAGDNLIGYALQGLVRNHFSDTIDYNVCHLTKEMYDEKCHNRNILFGPGGIVTGSPDAAEPDRLFLKHITHDLLDKWDRDGRQIVFFGSGTNSSSNYRSFTEKSGKLLNHLVSISRYLYLRGVADIEVISQQVDRKHHYKLKFQPCPSMFLDKIYDIVPEKKDRLAINYNFGTLTTEEAKAHPIRRFVEYTRAQGLTPVLWANHPVDKNDALADVFQGEFVYNSPKYEQKDIIKAKKANKKAKFKNSLHQDADLAADFNGFRFAFGKRLHGYLPFVSFGTISVFLSNRAVRRRIPGTYFQLPELSLPFDRDEPEAAADQMIAKLDYLIKNEESLASQMAEARSRLFALTEDNLNEMEDVFRR